MGLGQGLFGDLIKATHPSVTKVWEEKDLPEKKEMDTQIFSLSSLKRVWMSTDRGDFGLRQVYREKTPQRSSAGCRTQGSPAQGVMGQDCCEGVLGGDASPPGVGCMLSGGRWESGCFGHGASWVAISLQSGILLP